MEIEIEEIPVAAYDRHAQIESIIHSLMSGESHLSFSSLKEFKKSPADFIAYKLKEKKTTPAMIFGSLIHCLILEPHKFEDRYSVMDDTDICVQIGGLKPRATNKYKEWKEIYLAEIGGKTPVSQNDYNKANIIANNCKYNRASAKVLALCPIHESSLEWKFENFKFKGFLDGKCKNEKPKAIMDIKKVVDASPKKAHRTIIDMGYYLQIAMYATGLEHVPDCYIICVDDKGGVSVHLLHKHLIEHGLEEYSRLLKQFNTCYLNDAFNQSYDFYAERHDGIFVADKPAYLY